MNKRLSFLLLTSVIVIGCAAHADAVSVAQDEADLDAAVAAITQQAVVSPTLAPTSAHHVEFEDGEWGPGYFQSLATGPKILSPNFVTGIIAPHPASSYEVQHDLIDLRLQQHSLRDSKTNLLTLLENDGDPHVADIFALHGLLKPFPANKPFWDLMDAVDSEVSWFTLRDQMSFAVPHPSALDASIIPTIEVPKRASYPAEQAGKAYGVALILSRLNPDCATTYMGLASDVAVRLEIAGVHTKTESLAGQKLATAVVKAILKTPQIDKLARDMQQDMLLNGTPFLECVGK